MPRLETTIHVTGFLMLFSCLNFSSFSLTLFAFGCISHTILMLSRRSSPRDHGLRTEYGPLRALKKFLAAQCLMLF